MWKVVNRRIRPQRLKFLYNFFWGLELLDPIAGSLSSSGGFPMAFANTANIFAYQFGQLKFNGSSACDILKAGLAIDFHRTGVQLICDETIKKFTNLQIVTLEIMHVATSQDGFRFRGDIRVIIRNQDTSYMYQNSYWSVYFNASLRKQSNYSPNKFFFLYY